MFEAAFVIARLLVLVPDDHVGFDACELRGRPAFASVNELAPLCVLRLPELESGESGRVRRDEAQDAIRAPATCASPSRGASWRAGSGARAVFDPILAERLLERT